MIRRFATRPARGEQRLRPHCGPEVSGFASGSVVCGVPSRPRAAAFRRFRLARNSAARRSVRWTLRFFRGGLVSPSEDFIPITTKKESGPVVA